MSEERHLKYLKYVAANVRRRRAALELTQEALSEGAGLTYRYLQDVEAGRKNITIDVLVRLSEALGVAPGDLLRRARLAVPRPGRPTRRAKLAVTPRRARAHHQ